VQNEAVPGDGTEKPYRIVDTRTRRRAGVAYLVMAGIGAAIVVAAGVDMMWLTAIVPIVALAAYEFAGAWAMPVGDMRAIEIAAEAASFGVGHGSATLGYRGVLARPVWQVLVFSDAPTPDRQALVTVDAITGEVTGRYEEPVEAP
jgi:hypothetical protein